MRYTGAIGGPDPLLYNFRYGQAKPGTGRDNRECVMSLFDSLKNVFGKPESGEDVTVSPSQMLRDAGIDPSGLKFEFGSEGSITVSGSLADEADHQKVVDILSAVPGIERVEDQIAEAMPAEESVQDSTADEPEAAEYAEIEYETPAAQVPEDKAAANPSGQTYTVQSGDTLWKIAEEVYGDGSKYMKIFDANSELLEHPDRIFPGQALVIPDLEV